MQEIHGQCKDNPTFDVRFDDLLCYVALGNLRRR